MAELSVEPAIIYGWHIPTNMLIVFYNSIKDDNDPTITEGQDRAVQQYGV